ncbi:MAG: hypothetical protein K0S33_1735 [Bacteroidetes bacterium]|jgi:hypothetical protein|nr:hypothetical protein [Bacteroidota bacterium]
MAVGEIFKQLEKQTEQDLLRRANRITYQAQSKFYENLSDSKSLLRKKVIAREVIWFFASVAIGFLMGYLFYEIFTTWFPEIKTPLIKQFLQTNANFLYFLSALSFIGVYICRATVWALSQF